MCGEESKPLQSQSGAPTGHPSAWISLSSLASRLAEIEAISEDSSGKVPLNWSEGRGKSEAVEQHRYQV